MSISLEHRLRITAASAAGATALVSADTGFAEVPTLAHVMPDVAGVATLLDA